jgi:hypothetical protein
MTRGHGVRAAALAAAALAAPVVARADADETPLVLLVQGDLGTATRVRRLRVGDDLRAGSLRARVVLEGQPLDQPFGALDGGRLPAIGSVRFTDAFVAYGPLRAFEIDVGSQRVPFSLSRQVDEADLRLPERAAIFDQATPDFRAGVGLGGDLGLLQYRGAVMGGDPALDRTFAGGVLAAFRLAAEPLGPMGVAPWRRRPQDERDPWYAWWRFSAGASVLYGTLLGPRTLGAGGDAQLQWRRFTATSEYVFVHAPSGNRQGGSFEPGLFVVRDRLEVVGRLAWSQADGAAGGGALSLYMTGDGAVGVRLQAGFEKRRGADLAILRLTLAL